MRKKVIMGLGILVLILIWSAASIYPDWLWFENLGFSSIFWTMFLTKFGVGLVVWLFLILIIWLNLYAARRLSPAAGEGMSFRDGAGYLSQVGLSSKTLTYFLLALILIGSLIIASKASLQWDVVLRFLYQQPFGSSDPIFHNDIEFYVFTLPFYVFIRDGLLVLLFFAGGLAILWYLKNGALKIEGEFLQAEGAPPSLPKISVSMNAKRHLVFLGGIIALLLAWGYHLKIYGLLYSTHGPAFGASYTDVHIRILAFRVLIFMSLGLAVMLFLNAAKFRKKLIWLSLGGWLASLLLFSVVLPGAVQKFVVKPNELAKESPYIAYNIDYTRKAYNLNNIKEIDFAVNDKLHAEDIKGQNVTIQNIRIWDERPLLQTYRQIQAIRLYYDFNNVDVDRYLINGKYRQVMLAARELVVNQLPPKANTWVNRHLIYTHGYGLASSPVNEVTREGLPHLLIKDLPPSIDAGFDLKIERPEIYYGEKTDEYVLVGTKAKEFDYPKGDKNVYASYQGKGGVPIRSLVRRLFYAFEFLDPQILFTTSLGLKSRIMYNRRIDKRVDAIAPFLDYDGDPYLVVSGGKLYWIQDAYTTSDMYPYSRRSKGFNKGLNYIRNSVKVIIDAYNGNVSFYMIDEKDPILRTYSSIFPDLFKPFKDMPKELKKHIRYPRDLFKIQVDAYTRYHMLDVQVFYNQEDLWQAPDELYGDTRQKMEPYYIIIKLPEGEKEEFLLMLPFTPSKKDNMIGWLAARSDLPNYGNLLVYKLPKEKLVYGPMQIEARVDQQTEISRELSLWGQRGSRVIRGNLLAIPISDSFVYVEPIYLEAKQEERESPAPGQPPQGGFRKTSRGGRAVSSRLDKSRAASLPELKRVIVALGSRLVMEENLDKALSTVLGEGISPKETAPPAISQTPDISRPSILALEHYKKAKAYLREGNWTGYGKELEKLEKILKDMAEAAKERD